MAEIESSPVWTSTPNAGLDGLKFHPSRPLPELGPTSCLVEIEAVSLNYRDIAMLTGQYPMASKDDIIPCSDGSGTIIKIGSGVTQFAKGDRVCTLFNPSHQSGYFKPDTRQYSLGSSLDGVLRKYAVFDETALVAPPKNITLQQASTLPCAATTAWNAFYGVVGRDLKAGDYVLTQGTGGVSLFAIQIALAAGATVISTTSSAEKADKLKELGVHHVINYKENPQWGEAARKLTPDSAGVDHILEVGGDTTMPQSLKAIKMEGVISIIGFLGGKSDTLGTKSVDFLTSLAIVRGISVGSKEQFKAMNAFIEEHDLQPIVDATVFPFEEARGAFEALQGQKQWGKIVIQVR